MADSKKEAPGDVQVDAPPEGVGINPQQVAATSERKDADVKGDLRYPGDVELGVLKAPEHDADKTSYPVGDVPPLERPPYATARPDVPIVQSAVLGAGEHTPPDPEKFTPDGRPRDLQ